ncbi:DUF3098 domain-containing protein [Parvicella tangerina]|uniref:DUF3098 domain-containing protein n=1 Tax=Parvicella tangerina TaxID=2829795 RepID=A0A916JQ14_9FLAO|nr:DUF3098 domain-containing protein [Parvicella tangerina]CAG5085185.1 hypothetical protein CRYO30217_02673 [Parvicella tangerina]
MSKEELGLALPKKNYYYIIAGVVVVLIGFVLMAGGGSDDPMVFDKEELFSFRRITLAPFMVILGYGIVVWGILKKPQEEIVKVDPEVAEKLSERAKKKEVKEDDKPFNEDVID